jgi:hypothetical protein
MKTLAGMEAETGWLRDGSTRSLTPFFPAKQAKHWPLDALPASTFSKVSTLVHSLYESQYIQLRALLRICASVLVFVLLLRTLVRYESECTKELFEFSSQSVLGAKASADLILHKDEMRVVMV